MKQLSYLVILVLGLTVSFSQSKPCCKSKAGTEKVACKTSKANIENNDKSIISISNDKLVNEINCQNTANIKSVEQKNCNGCSNKVQWWMFWKKQGSCSSTTTASNDIL